MAIRTMERTATDYTSDELEVSKSVLVELFLILKSYSDALVLVGGWAPYFILKRFKKPDNEFEHVGSIDIDVAINPKIVSSIEYATMVELLEKKGYVQRLDKVGNPIPFSFVRNVKAHGKEYTIHVDFLSSEYDIFLAKKPRHRKIQPGLKARTMHGCEIVFDHNFEEEITATLPDGGEARTKIKIADVVSSITTKGITLGERLNNKDAYDLFSIIANYKDGVDSVAEEIRAFLSNELVKEAISNIQDKFANEKSAGPFMVANFLDGDEETKRRYIADSFIVISEFLKLISK